MTASMKILSTKSVNIFHTSSSSRTVKVGLKYVEGNKMGKMIESSQADHET
jgi:hypothetical protein